MLRTALSYSVCLALSFFFGIAAGVDVDADCAAGVAKKRGTHEYTHSRIGEVPVCVCVCGDDDGA